MFFNKTKKKKSSGFPEEIEFHGTANVVTSPATKEAEKEYLDRFLSRNRIESPRKGIFVSRDLVHRIAKYAGVMGQGEASIGAYVEEIILDHFERNSAVIKSLFHASPAHRL